MHTCKNCNNSFEGNYCNQCGQRSDTERISWHELAHHVPHALFHVDKGIFYSIKELFLRPGKTLREYISGKRIYHFNPLLFLFLVGGFTSYMFAHLHLPEILSDNKLERMEETHNLIAHKYFAIKAIVIIPFISLICWFLFREKKYSYPEVLVAHIYIVTESMLILIAMLPLMWLLIKMNFQIYGKGVIVAVLISYLFFAYYEFYEARKSLWMVIKVIVAIISFFLLLWGLTIYITNRLY